MTHTARNWRAVAVVACLGLATPAALAQGSPAQEEQLPQSIREAYQRALEFGEAPAPATSAPAPASGKPGPSLWFDPIHYVGIAGGVLTALALLAGLYLYFFAGRYRGPDRVQRRWRLRYLHIFLGASAVGLALAHSLLRFVQSGEVELSLKSPTVVLYAFLLLALSGVLRVVPPRKWARYAKVFMWTHRALVAIVLVVLLRHVLLAYQFFGKGG